VFALRHNHTLCDATGIVQFINAVAELAGAAGTDGEAGDAGGLEADADGVGEGDDGDVSEDRPTA
jgi:hypothetical protein